MRRGVDYLPRRVTDLVNEALADTRVVVITGARQVGKSTLAERVLRAHEGAVARFLDNSVTRAAAEEDPARFVEHRGLMLIDEVQRVPDLWLAIKNTVDRDPRPGRFLLTGSARLLELRSVPDALPGRSETIELWPLSQAEVNGEIDGGADGFVDAAFRHGADLRAPVSPLRRGDYVDRLARGGYPEAVKRETPRRRRRFFDSYLADLVSRDVKQVAEIQRAGDMRRLVSLLAAQVGGLLNVNRLASDLALSAPTTRSYLEILETIYLIRQVPAWATSATTRAVGRAKVIFVDSGLAHHLAASAVADTPVGGLMESFVLSELARQLTWCDSSARLYHYRDRDGYEVDAVIEDDAGRVIGLEVKAAETVKAADFRGLRVLQRRLGERFRAGFVLYCGPDSLSFGDGLTCLPIAALWMPDASSMPGGGSGEAGGDGIL
jgi:uncharacterized protein